MTLPGKNPYFDDLSECDDEVAVESEYESVEDDEETETGGLSDDGYGSENGSAISNRAQRALTDDGQSNKEAIAREKKLISPRTPNNGHSRKNDSASTKLVSAQRRRTAAQFLEHSDLTDSARVLKLICIASCDSYLF